MIEIDGKIKKIIGKKDFPKKKTRVGGEEAHGISLSEIVGPSDIFVISEDGYKVHFKREEVENLLLLGDRIIAPQKGLSVKHVKKILVEGDRSPIAIVDLDLEPFRWKTPGNEKTDRFMLKKILPPVFSYIIAYSKDSYHATFSFDEAQKISFDSSRNIVAPQSREARRLRDVCRIEIY